MSRHHLLPPIAYTPPPPPPKRNAGKKRRIDAGEDADVEEVAQGKETGTTGRTNGTTALHPPQAFPAIEAADRKPGNAVGRLSASTLTAMLKAQELK